MPAYYTNVSFHVDGSCRPQSLQQGSLPTAEEDHHL
jgi:hypothetical protein